jgi:hypothetical protein
VSDPVVRGRAEAAAVVLAAVPSLAPGAAALRRSGVVRALVPLAMAGLFVWTAHPIAAGIAAALGGLTLLLALVSPTRGYLALKRAVDGLGRGIGTLLGFLLLAPVFYLFVTPLGLLTRRGRGDRIGRAFDRTMPSYWRPLPDKPAEQRRAELARPY